MRPAQRVVGAHRARTAAVACAVACGMLAVPAASRAASPSFAPAHAYSVFPQGTQPAGVATGDLDGNGTDEILIAGDVTGVIDIFKIGRAHV